MCYKTWHWHRCEVTIGSVSFNNKNIDNNKLVGLNAANILVDRTSTLYKVMKQITKKCNKKVGTCHKSPTTGDG